VDFGLSDEQEQLRDSARELLVRECPMERVRKIAADPAGHDAALWRTFAEAGWLGILVPEAQGGAGLGMLDAAVVLHELGRAVAPGPFLASSIASVVALREGGSRALQAEWLPRIAAGEATATLALFENAEATLEGGVLRDRATRRAGGFLLDGTKLFVEYGALADLVLAAFRTARPKTKAAGDFEGVGLFAVPGGARGVKKEPLLLLDETRRSAELRFRAVSLPKTALLAGETARAADSARALRRALDATAIGLAAESLGGAERALERAVEYVKVREQFGRAVGSFQAVQHMAADAAAKIEPARALVWYAAWAFDARPKEAPLAASMAKAACCDVYRFVARTAIEMHGGIGFTWENDMHFFLKRSLANAAACGDSDWHRERVAELSRF
jgi:alkylation response protein AidB-like acyl-CoA dehydrogenase